MNWQARSGWIYQGTAWGDVQQKADANAIAVVYVDPRSANAAETVGAIRLDGATPGIYVAHNWWPNTSTVVFATMASNYVEDLLQPDEPVMFDLEPVMTVYAMHLAAEWRKRRQQRPTAVTVAPFQGAYVPVAALVSRGIHVYVQCYYGDTLPDGRLRPADPAAVCLEMAREGNPAFVHPFYDGAALPSDARDGCVFTLERLP